MIWLPEVGSTNTWLSQNQARLPDFSVAVARRQSAGRGQRGNSWESEDGKNLTFSMLYRPDARFRPSRQFSISEGVALAVTDALARFGISASVKWPNDIYVADRKIAGILIEHSLLGSSIQYTVIGIGLNVNQALFLSDAPNPVSMVQLAGREFDLQSVLYTLADALRVRLAETATDEGRAGLHRDFHAALWRGDGRLYPFRDAATGQTFQARIDHIEPDGFLCLEPGGRRYAFKEVAFLL